MKFIKNYACVFLKDISTLIIGDLHIGYEIELKKLGINVAYLDKIKEDIIFCKNKTNSENIVLLGDTKHSIGIPKNKTELNNLLNFFDFLLKNFQKVYVVKGNHDGLLEEILDIDIKKGLKIFSSRGFSIKKYGFFHGNAFPLESVIKSKTIFCSHVHPKTFLPKEEKYFEIRVFLIYKLKESYGKNKKLIVLPPFSSLIAGKDIDGSMEEESIFSKLVDTESLEILTLNGLKLVF